MCIRDRYVKIPTFGIKNSAFSDRSNISEFLIALILLLCKRDTARLNETTERGWKVEFKIKVLWLDRLMRN